MKAIATYLGANQTGAQFVRFLFTGALNSLFGYLIFALLIWCGASLLVALVGANTAGVLLNFQTIGRIVFRTAKWRLLLRFSAVYVGILVLNWFGLSGLVRVGIGTLLAQALLTPILAICAFLAHKFLVFEARPRTTGPTR
jgi:putative flippase GtrA